MNSTRYFVLAVKLSSSLGLENRRGEWVGRGARIVVSVINVVFVSRQNQKPRQEG